MNTNYPLFIALIDQEDEIFVDIDYSITEGQKGTHWQEEIEEDVEIESIKYGDIDIYGLFNDSMLDAIKKDILKENAALMDYCRECAYELDVA